LLACLTFPTISPFAVAAPKKRSASAPSARRVAPENPASKLSTAKTIDPELQAAIRNAPKASQWPEENHATLLDLEEVTVKPDGAIVAVCRSAYKIFNEDGRDLADVSLDYDADYENLEILQARTIQKNGKILNLRPKEIRVSSLYGDYPLYQDSKEANFSLPGIEDDCVIDYTYRQVTRPHTVPGHFWTSFGFTTFNPANVSRFTLKTPVGMKVNVRPHNGDKLQATDTVSKKEGLRVRSWRMTNVKPIEIEPMMPPMSEIASWIEVSSPIDWQGISRWWWKLAKPQMSPDAAIQSTVRKLTAGKKTEAEKTQAIYEWVTGKIRYVGLEFGDSAFKPHPASQVHEKLYGDCKDMAILLATMLRLAKVEAHPVLLYSSGDLDITKQLPSPQAFDHCIVKAVADGKPYWLDATDESNLFGDTPSALQGSDAFVIRDDGSGAFEKIPRDDPADNGLRGTMAINVRPDGRSDGEASVIVRGTMAKQIRFGVQKMTDKQKKEMAEAMTPGLSPGATLKDYSLSYVKGERNLGSYVIKIRFNAPNWAKSSGDMLVVSLGGAAVGAQSNPFNKEKRIWPIVSNDNAKLTAHCVLNLPDGYELTETPKSLDLVGPFDEFKRGIALSPDRKTLTVDVEVSSHPGRLPAGDYQKLKDYYDELIRNSGEELLLRKSSG
jgi:hypothetical protein